MKYDHSQFQDDPTHHPLDADLINYMGGRLAGSEEEDVQAHLVVCDECLDLFKDLRNFFDSHRPGEEVITEDIEAEWQAFLNRVKDKRPQPAALIPLESRRGFRLSSALPVAFAALLLIVLGLGFWALSQRRQKQQLAERLRSAEQRTAQLEAEQRDLADRFNRSEQEKRELQSRTPPPAEVPDRQPVETRGPELNVPIYDLYAKNFDRRSSADSDVNRIKAPANGSAMVMILNGDGVAASSSYAVEIVGERGRVIWRGKGLKKGHLGNLTVTIDRKLLPAGTYRLKLYGQDGQSTTAAAEYVLRVE